MYFWQWTTLNYMPSHGWCVIFIIMHAYPTLPLIPQSSYTFLVQCDQEPGSCLWHPQVCHSGLVSVSDIAGLCRCLLHFRGQVHKGHAFLQTAVCKRNAELQEQHLQVGTKWHRHPHVGIDRGFGKMGSVFLESLVHICIRYTYIQSL